jgi:hypothetical protein
MDRPSSHTGRKPVKLPKRRFVTQVADLRSKRAEYVRSDSFKSRGGNAMCFAGIEDEIIDLVRKHQLAQQATAETRLHTLEVRRRPELEPVTRPITVLLPPRSAAIDLASKNGTSEKVVN